MAQCDETHPVCSSCKRLGVECIWPDPLQLATSKRPRSIPRRRQTPSRCLDSLEDISRKLPWPCLDDSAGPAFTAEDMQLLHHYSTSTYATINTVPRQYPVWQHAAIRIGFQHRYVLRSLLALSALHLASTSDRSRLGSASVNFTLAITEMRQVLDVGVNEANAPAVFLFSATVVVHALAVGSIQEALNPVADFVQGLRMTKGIMSIVTPFYDVLLASEIEPLVTDGVFKGYGGAAEDILQLKVLLTEYGGGWTPEEDTEYAQAIDHLYAIACEARGCPAERSVLAFVFSWPHMLSERFLALLDECRPVAMIILLHFTALMHTSADLWWLCGWHERIKSFATLSLPPTLGKWIPA